MHELPQELAKSVRSWRASIYGSNSLHKQPSDIEKAEDDYGDIDFERALSPTESSVVLHPTKSRRALYQPQPRDIPHQLQHYASREQLRLQSNIPRSSVPAATPRRQGTLPQHTPAIKKGVFSSAPPVVDPDPAAGRLDDETTPLSAADFYELMGMRPPVSKQENPKALAIRHGLYARIQSRFHYTQGKYRIFDVLTYALLALQLALSATFIVLGSLAKVESHVAIAVLGAVSTVVAGVLALMKGQGLPNRLRQTRDGLRNVLFEAEELYWDVGADRPVCYKDIKKVREDFLRVTEEARRNHPDTWNTTSTGVAQGVHVGVAEKRLTLAPAATPKP
ncbi:hypothetical protein LTR56_014076 [Elasticomyces elasticus]|nr:hypothetical protein LTR22_019992 [Elasticomyces elasticus]KAK3636603.1 hypothetical protein LTR56_014076 [Elasticomyces elasticus]KAK4910925.1 hypothetical protein LTR49_020451 [Elasticomyces elasticus]KAK5760010.1 hypothetical protein LTS12_009906 [Elasticomyces elasticus]